MTNSADYILWGSSGHAKVLASLISLQGGNVVALFDNDHNAVPVIPRVPLYIGKEGFIRWRNSEPEVANLYGLVAIGGARGHDRLDVYEYFQAYGVKAATLIHPQASVCSTAVIGAGSQVLAQAVVSAGVRMGEACIVNHQALADHECVLGDGVHLAPGAKLCGCVTLGNNVMIGAGAVVLPRVTIGAGTVVGAGAVVLRDLPAGVVAIGSPARVVKYT